MIIAAIVVSALVFLWHADRANTQDLEGANSLFYTLASAAVLVGCILYMRGLVS